MYFVYRIDIGNRVYIGCTNDLRRRKDQHNENARKRKSKLGVFLNELNIHLELTDMKVLYEFLVRDDALRKEREVAMQLAESGEDILNDNYSAFCTRKGKNIGNTAKQYVLIDMQEHKAVCVENLRQYCLNNNLDYKLIQRTVHGNHVAYERYKAFYMEDWNAISDKNFYLFGNVMQTRDKTAIKTRADKTSKEYDVRFPNGEVHRVKNLDKFAKEHGINSGNLHASFTKQRAANGYQVIRRI